MWDIDSLLQGTGKKAEGKSAAADSDDDMDMDMDKDDILPKSSKGSLFLLSFHSIYNVFLLTLSLLT